MKRAQKGISIGAVLLLVPVAYWTISLHLRSRAVGEAAATAILFLSALNAHDYKGAHAMLDAPQQRGTTVAAMQADEEQIEKKHGKPLGKPKVDEYHPTQGLTIVVLSCNNAYQKESEPIRVVVVKATSGWRVSEYHYDFSPA